ncbi:cytochrome c oxidase assembly protein [Thiohalobacter sp. COW1]|uniref:Cytochrome c oxidase assembly protein CtaG n=1 Tax=Thiohalobacter thiocyanaticus TaxID=585455 RepID=A0A1Z4VLF6_9GAMM|nr:MULTISPECIES: cytochrome c oxidase assembly protein [Thiohalobacter]BAZ92436.1 cytochrome c oxidase assembly protein CtaG [Thiohalobacter thiocyanaticus]BCO32579.1 cytochrome c oxidase assembly protein [Thiohalobacter sp. COW1]
MSTQDDPRQQATRRTLRRMLFVTVGMFGFGFAMVPFYNVFCDITGLNGKTADGPAQTLQESRIDSDRTVTVEFIANLNQAMPWEFRPEVNKMQVQPGKAYTVRFYAHNNSGREVVAHAVPSVAPGLAAKHFHKTECFCFTEQRFGADEGRWMPVRFMVDPELSDKHNELTLSYTFFDTGARTAAAPKGLEAVHPSTQTN